MLDQVQPEARLLTLPAHPRIRQPDRRHQIPLREHREDPGIDLVGLARQRRQTLHLGRVGDQHVPAQLLQRVMHEPGAGHRLDHAADRLAETHDRAIQRAQPVRVSRHRQLAAQLPLVAQQAHIDLPATEIQPNVHHEHGPPRLAPRMTREASHRGGPPFIAVQSGSRVAWQLRGATPCSVCGHAEECGVPCRS